MRLQAFCSQCDGENDLGKQKFVTRAEMLTAQGESVDFKCKHCKRQSTAHIDDINSAPGYGIYILVPSLLLILFPVNYLIIEVTPGPIAIVFSLGAIFYASKRFHSSELNKSKKFNDDYIDPSRKEAQILEKNKKYKYK
ncbi:MAG: hypothetical protein JXQ87_08870 [Bacteroidia bacterium]